MNVCPKCGAEALAKYSKRKRNGEPEPTPQYIEFACESVQWTGGEFEEEKPCLRRQLLQEREKVEAAKQLCEIYFDIALTRYNEDAVRAMRDRAITAAEAAEAVRRGVEQAKAGEISDGPDLDSDLADSIP